MLRFTLLNGIYRMKLMNFFTQNENKAKMNWILADSADKIYEAEDLSQKERVLILKYSPKCVISHIMKTLLQKEWAEGEMRMKTYLVNVIDNTDISNDISKRYGVEHESPQAIILEKGKAVYNAAHGQVLYSNLKQYAN